MERQWQPRDQRGFFQFEIIINVLILSTTSRELLSQFSTCSGWRWFDVGDKLKINMYSWNNFIEICLLKPLAVKKSSKFSMV